MIKSIGFYTVLFFLLGCTKHSSGAISPNVPPNYQLLKAIFGSYDADSSTFTRKHKTWEPRHIYYPKVQFNVAFAQPVVIEGEQLLLVICKAPVGHLHFHTSYVVYRYYFEIQDGKWVLWKRFGENEEILHANISGFELIDIGVQKKALLSKHLHAGNGHEAQGYTLFGLSLNAIKTIGGFELFYSNWQWVGLGQPKNQPCNMVKEYALSFEVVKSQKRWYDIKQLRKNYKFTKGCQKKYVDSRKTVLFRFNGKEYKEMK